MKIFNILFFLSVSVFAEPVVLVTGGAGYIGSHTCKALKDAGFIPVAFDSLVRGNEENVKWGPLVRGDICNPEDLNHAFEVYQPIAVIHLAALRSVGESNIDPSSYYHVNVTGTLNLLRAMQKYQVRQLVFSSSCTVYGNVPSSTILESMPHTPINPYGASKCMAERMIDDFAKAYKMNWVVLRYFNAAGAGPDYVVNQADPLLISRACYAVLHSDNPLCIFGIDYPTKDGTAIRDYIHVIDLAEAHVISVQRLLEDPLNIALNLGTGKGASVFEILQTVEQVTGKKVPVHISSRRQGDAVCAVADPSLSKKILRFTPSHSSLDEMISSHWKAFNKVLSKETCHLSSHSF